MAGMAVNFSFVGDIFRENDLTKVLVPQQIYYKKFVKSVKSTLRDPLLLHMIISKLFRVNLQDSRTFQSKSKFFEKRFVNNL